VRFQILTETSTKMAVFWDVTTRLLGARSQKTDIFEIKLFPDLYEAVFWPFVMLHIVIISMVRSCVKWMRKLRYWKGKCSVLPCPSC